MNHLPFLLGGALFFATFVVLAAVAYACLQLLSWVIGGLIELVLGAVALAWYRQWAAIEADDWVGLSSVTIALLVMTAFAVGFVQ